jgi:type 1 glutamine amidotransferase
MRIFSLMPNPLPVELCQTMALLLVMALGAAPPVAAQQSNWEEKKAQRFRPITPAEEMAMLDAVPDEAAAKPARPRRLLVFYRCEGFIHTSIPHGNLATEMMGRKTAAFQVDLADTYDVFTKENLARYDAIVLNNTTHMRFPKPAQEQALLEFVREGKGLVGYHAASDNFYAHPAAAAMIGGQFNGHPWGAGGTWAFRLDDPEHRLNAAFGGNGFWHQDEIYQYRPDSYQGPEVLRILVSLDMSKEAVTKQLKPDGGGYPPGKRQVPVSWLRDYGKGRVFITNLGHREETFRNPTVLQHMLDGIQFALGDLPAETTPTAQIEPRDAAPAPPR